ncbi:MAG: LysE family transporter [Bacteroidales bacterium]|nr:LysE family transporter [Bacteroidales bacterium]
MNAIYNGILLGLFLSIFVGATFFMLIGTSINKGFKPALAMNLGVFLSDVAIILVAYFGTSEFLNNLINNHVFKMSGGIAFLGFGGYYLLKKHIPSDLTVNRNNNYSRLFLNGFLVNTLNPSVIAFWLGSIVLAISYNKYTDYQIFMFFLSALLVVLITDILKIYFASRLKRLINYKVLRVISVITGIVFILFSIKILFFS